MSRNQRWTIALVLTWFGLCPVFAGEFDCADPSDLAPGTTDVVVTKEASVTEAAPGDEITYTIRVHNCGPIAATSVEFEDLLPLRSIVTSLSQVSGPTFDLSPPFIGVKLFTSDPIWGGTISTLSVGDTAVFEVVIRVDYF